MNECEGVGKGIEEAIDYYDHRFAELVEDKQRELGNPKFMETTDLHAKAMNEVVGQILSLKVGSKTLKEWIELYEKGKLRMDEEAENILKCIKDAKRVHPDWGINDIIELLEFRNETRQAVRSSSKSSLENGR